MNTVKMTESTWRKVRRSLQTRDAGRTVVLPRQAGTNLVYVQNLSGQPIPQFGVLGINGFVIDPAQHPEAFTQNPVLAGGLPAAGTNFVVTAAPAPVDGIVPAYAAGVCPVLVNVLDASDTCAHAVDNTVTYLVSSDAGVCSILWKQPVTGQQWSLVRFGAAGGASSGIGTVEFVRITDGSTHPMSGFLYTFNPADGTWTFTGNPVQMYRFPTHTNNDMYVAASGLYYAAVKMSATVYVALHAVPRQFDIYP